jgi:plasmid stability protein
VSNLNTLYLANRAFLTRERLPRALDEMRQPLARLAFNAARMAATGEDAANAPELLLQAYRLGANDPDLVRRIDELARHLGVEQRNYTVLAERFRDRDVEALGITPETPNDDLKGMAWALRERWQRHLEAEEPDLVFSDVAAAREVIPATHLDSLRDWEGEAREVLRDALAAEIRELKKRDKTALAAGLRDYRADYLGPEWPDRADAAWWTAGLRVVQVLLFAVTLAFLLLLGFVYRYLVYPYVVQTTDAYKVEFERRQEEWRALDRAVTGPEMYERERLRRGGS